MWPRTLLCFNDAMLLLEKRKKNIDWPTQSLLYIPVKAILSGLASINVGSLGTIPNLRGGRGPYIYRQMIFFQFMDWQLILNYVDNISGTFHYSKISRDIIYRAVYRNISRRKKSISAICPGICFHKMEFYFVNFKKEVFLDLKKNISWYIKWETQN